jgi:BMFP domain-containing protein YqiC
MEIEMTILVRNRERNSHASKKVAKLENPT